MILNLLLSGWVIAAPSLYLKEEKVTGKIRKAFWVDYGKEISTGWVDEKGKFQKKKQKLKPFWVVHLEDVQGLSPAVIKKINFHSEYDFPVQQALPQKKGGLILLLRISGGRELMLKRGGTLEIYKFAYLADEYGGALGYEAVKMKEE